MTPGVARRIRVPQRNGAGLQQELELSRGAQPPLRAWAQSKLPTGLSAS